MCDFSSCFQVFSDVIGHSQVFELHFSFQQCDPQRHASCGSIVKQLQLLWTRTAVPVEVNVCAPN